jgi:serum/glucocorticoid-regulated kinase 2
MFDLLEVIGKGSFGKVMQVLKKDMQRVYALKMNIASPPGEITHILTERTVLPHVEVNRVYAVTPRPRAFPARSL